MQGLIAHTTIVLCVSRAARHHKTAYLLRVGVSSSNAAAPRDGQPHNDAVDLLLCCEFEDAGGEVEVGAPAVEDLQGSGGEAEGAHCDAGAACAEIDTQEAGWSAPLMRGDGRGGGRGLGGLCGRRDGHASSMVLDVDDCPYRGA